jgi:hypothetical protein
VGRDVTCDRGERLAEHCGDSRDEQTLGDQMRGRGMTLVAVALVWAAWVLLWWVEQRW